MFTKSTLFHEPPTGTMFFWSLLKYLLHNCDKCKFRGSVYCLATSCDLGWQSTLDSNFAGKIQESAGE